MATEFAARTWEECEEKIGRIEERYGSNQPGVWFRGQSDSTWELLSTLERRSRGLEVSDYYAMIRQMRPVIEAFTETKWEVPDREEVTDRTRTNDLFHQFLGSAYSYMAHLRHHNFPSPFLDWTGSPYVAAYFAFAAATHAGRVAITYIQNGPNKSKFKAVIRHRFSRLARS